MPSTAYVGDKPQACYVMVASDDGRVIMKCLAQCIRD